MRLHRSLRAIPSIFISLASLALLAANAAELDVRTFQVRGVVEKLIPDKQEALIHHDAIPGYMDAMAMPFHTKPGSALPSLKPGDTISFRLNVTPDDGWIDQIKVITAAPSNAQIPPPSTLPNLDPIQLGQPFPDATLTDENGHELKLASYRGRALAITFIFTRCPYPAFCPRITENFAAVQARLSADTSAPKNWQLLSITIDPAHDTPEALRTYAAQHKADPAHWHFATGSLRAITTLTLRCGLNFWDENGVIQHNLRTIVIDPAGKVRHVFPDNDWKPEALTSELKAAAKDVPSR